MTPFRDILFRPLAQTGNAEAVGAVSTVAAHDGARLTLLGIVPEPSRLQRLFQRSDLVEHAVEAAMEDLTAEFALWCPDDVDFERSATVTVGRPATMIIDRVRTGTHDLVAVSAAEDERPDPTVKRLLRDCPAPVWVIRPSRGTEPRIVAAVNPDPEEAELNHAILKRAAEMREVFGGELHALHAWEFYGETTLRHSAFLHPDAGDVDAIVEAEHASHATALADLVSSSSCADAPWQLHLVRGTPHDAIADYVSREAVDLLVLGTVGRSGLPEWILGNTAEALLDDVRCSILTLRPPWSDGHRT